EEEGSIDQVELIMSVNGVAMQAKDGAGPFEDEALSNPEGIVALGNIYPEVMQVVTLEDSGIESIADLEGANVELGPPGSGTEVAARQILEAYGIDPDNDINSFDSTFGDAATALGDGQVDAAFGILSVPAAGIIEVSANNDVRILPIDGEEADELMAADESYSPLTIDGGTYSGQDDDVVTLTQWATLYSLDSLDEDIAYELTKVMYEEAGAICHDVGDQVLPETALDGLGNIELHPGAERYYEEQDLLDGWTVQRRDGPWGRPGVARTALPVLRCRRCPRGTGSGLWVLGRSVTCSPTVRSGSELSARCVRRVPLERAGRNSGRSGTSRPRTRTRSM